jgi:hypothetical protein
VAILGSETDDGELMISPATYYVVDWQEREDSSGGSGSSGTDTDKETEIKGARYLSVPKLDYTLYNVNNLEIPYITSDECELANLVITYKDYSGINVQDRSVTDITLSNGAYTFHQRTGESTFSGQLYLANNRIQFIHGLRNDTSTSNYDVSAYSISFTLRHKDAALTYFKDITITQYPAITIDAEKNSNADGNGYAFVNNNQPQRQEGDYWSGYVTLVYPDGIGSLGSVPGSGTSSNSNYNMIIIETTVLPQGSSYLLGDPRKNSVDNLVSGWPATVSSDAASWSANVQPISGGSNRRMTYYYPSNNSSDSDNVIAPRFRIASSKGATQPMTYPNAFRRCATYQEDGYPAGRWRVPTKAEIEYIAKLNADGKIDRLLGSESGTTDYWCNSGYVTVEIGQTPIYNVYSGESTTRYVRCVYDDWYWSNTTYPRIAQGSRNNFRWGDQLRAQ